MDKATMQKVLVTVALGFFGWLALTVIEQEKKITRLETDYVWLHGDVHSK